MRELTTYELDAELAEQLPARELMGRNCGCSSSFTYNQGSYDGNFDGSGNGLVGIAVANGSLDGNNVVVGL
jgi:hypothetical protein